MLELKNITKIYKMEEVEQKALNKVSICFRKNEFVSILGQSGSGKSTLMKTPRVKTSIVHRTIASLFERAGYLI